MLRVYTAAKVHRGKELEDAFSTATFAFLHARWLKLINLNVEDSAENAKHFWVDDITDAVTADVVLVYAGPTGSDVLRGALVEVGAALAAGVPVLIVGDSPSYGTWQYHPGVMKCGSLTDAYVKLERMNKEVEKRRDEGTLT